MDATVTDPSPCRKRRGVGSVPDMPRDAAGELLREWRRRRRLSQMDLALDAGVSTRHLSFLKTGRSRPSAAMIARLGERLDIPLRERNRILLAAGHAPVHAEHDLDEPALEPVRAARDAILAGHEPFPALVVDRHWEVVAMNDAAGVLLEGVAPDLLEPPVNALRVTLHPRGMAPRSGSLPERRAHLLDRLARQAGQTGDPALAGLLAELRGYGDDDAPGHEEGAVAVALRLRTGDEELAFISTVSTFGTALDVTVAELAIESFFPADAATRERMMTSQVMAS